MRLKGGAFFLLLIVACVTLAKPPDDKPGKKKGQQGLAKKMMKKCLKKGHAMPEMTELKAIFENSNLPMVDTNSGQMDTFLSRFLKVMQSSSANPRKKSPKPDKMGNKMWNCSNLPAIIRLIRNSSEATACYMRAYVAPLALRALAPRSECNMTSEDYAALLWAVKPVLKDRSFSFMDLPFNIDTDMISQFLGETSQEKLMEALEWGKEHITQKYFNCTTRPPSDTRTKGMERCEPSLPWLNSEALGMLGPDVYSLKPRDLDYAHKDELCEFMFNNGFKNATTMRRKKKKKPMPPSLSEKFWEKFQDCFEGKHVLAENVDKLSILACKYIDGSSLSSNLSLELLSDPNICKQLKKRIIRSWMTKMNTEDLYKCGSSLNLLPPKVLARISAKDLDKAVRNKDINWTRGQQRVLVGKLCQDKCKDMSGEKLMELRSIVQGLPSSALRNVREVLNNTEGMNKLSRRMNRRQRMFVLQRLSRDMDPSQLVRKLPDPLLCVLPLDEMASLSITSDLQEKTWCPPQAAFLAKEMLKGKKKSFRGNKLRSLLRGVACEMINNVPDSEAQNMALEITEAPQWLSKNLAGCVAKKLFVALETERANYFKTITEEELDKIPTCLLLRLPPSKVKDLPDSLCPALLEKLEEADLSSLPHRSKSVPALTQKDLFCLGEDLSVLTNDDVLRLGPFLCELGSSQLRLMASDVLNSTLVTMASCEYIPKRNRADIIKLVMEIFGNSSVWSQQTMEILGPLILFDDNAVSALPNTPWMKDVLLYLMTDRKYISNALKEKFFQVATTSKANRYTRAADTEGLTEDDIEDLGMDNVYWSPEKLNKISTDTLSNTIEILGAIPDFSKKQLDVICPKAKILLETGAISVKQMGCILRCYDSTELEELPLSLDDLEVIAICDWNESQVKAVGKAVAKNNNLTAETLDANTMVSLNRFICGLSFSEIQQLSKEDFKFAAGLIDVSQCSFEVLQQFKDCAVSAFGSPETWSEAQMSELDCIVAGLNETELASLDPSVFSFINDSCIPLIPPNNFAALSVKQLEALNPESGDRVTDEQKQALGNEQKDALERASTGTITLTQRSSLSGAPSLSVEGIAAFMKPLLFLLMGFLLL